MISFKNREELVKFVQACSDSEYSPEEVVDDLIKDMHEAGEITVYALEAERFLKDGARAFNALGDTEGNAQLSALLGIGFALMHGSENAEMFYAGFLDRTRAEER